MKELAVKLIVTLSLFLSFRFLFDHIKLISTQPNNYVKDEELERLKVREKINAYIEELNFKLTTLNKSSSNFIKKVTKIEDQIEKIEEEAREKKVENLINSPMIMELKDSIRIYKSVLNT